MQVAPISVVLGGDRDEVGVVRFAAIAQDKHHLAGLAAKFLLGQADEPLGLSLVIDRRVEHHDARELERVVEARDVPPIGFVGDGRDIHAGNVGGDAIVVEGRLVVFIVDHRAERSVGLLLEMGIERERLCLGGSELAPIVVQQDMLRVAGQSAPRGILVVESQERVAGVGYDLQKSVAEEGLVEGEFADHLTERLVMPVGTTNKRGKFGNRRFVADEAFAGNVVRFVVDDAAMGGRATCH